MSLQGQALSFSVEVERQVCSDLSAKPDFLGPSRLRGDETRHGNLQQPPLVVDGPTTSLPLPYLPIWRKM
ncbi:hypothetical protein H5410_025663 [Solanum commersonii]|uniref:Uncharacterized protein n=1 Tax=Solanum commersonii TaxID=4109 RepID=A0A9J5YTS7_SOLCO|nr:hypothetical protein H5410_025663 [Solanum commersonii]